jgi:dolichol-phosphate mannosyltransferase
MPSVSLVIAAYNEAESLATVFQRGLSVLQQCTDDYEVVILDDGSTDQTRAVAEELRDCHPETVRVLYHEQNQGICATFEKLYASAQKEYVFDVPGDGEFPPEALLEIIPLLDDFDVVICNRLYRNYTMYRKLLSFLYRFLPRLLFRVDLFDPGSIKCRKREVIQEIEVQSRSVFAEAERMIRAVRRGYRVGKVDIRPELRVAGKARGASWRNVYGATVDLLRLWFRLVVFRQKP